MNSSSWKRLESLFAQARVLEGGQRTAFIDESCRGDASLRDELLALLNAHDRRDDFLSPPSSSELLDSVSHDQASWSGEHRLAGYEKVRLIARGGMGEVYLARRADDSFDKQVAIKIIRRNVATTGMLHRFHRERQALAQLDHPNITRLLDGGTTEDGLPYLVMEYIRGEPIVRSLEEASASLESRLEHFQTVCEAVQFAHRNLIVHRDLKPSNILITDQGDVRLLDFGIAHLLEGDSRVPQAPHTVTRSIALTPEYSSPEQIRGEPVTTSSDIYSLGIVLFELLTGTRPFAVGGIHRYEAERVLCEEDPPLPSMMRREVSRHGPIQSSDLRGDLDRIVTKALEKEPSRRYQSVEQLREDVSRFVRGHPISVRADSFIYRATKFAKRHRTQVCAITLTVLALIATLFFVTSSWLQAKRANHVAETQSAQAEEARQLARGVTRFLEGMLASASPYVRGRDISVEDLLASAEPLIAERLGERPDVEAAVRLALARTHRSLFLLEGAIPHTRNALAFYRARKDRDAIAECLTMLATDISELSFEDSRDCQGVVAMQLEALALRHEEGLGDSAPIADILQGLGLAYWAEARPGPPPPQCESSFLDAIAMYERLGLRESPESAFAWMGWGHVLDNWGRIEEAELAFRTAIAIYGKHRGPVGRYALNAIESLARLLAGQHRFDEALSWLHSYLEQAPSAYPLWSTKNVMWTLTLLEFRAGKREEAQASLRHVLVFECELLSRDHPEWSPKLKPLAQEARGEIRPPRLFDLLSRTLALFLQIRADDPQRAKGTLEVFSRVAHGLGGSETTRRLLLGAEERLQADYPESHPIRVSIQKILPD